MASKSVGLEIATTSIERGDWFNEFNESLERMEGRCA